MHLILAVGSQLLIYWTWFRPNCAKYGLNILSSSKIGPTPSNWLICSQSTSNSRPICCPALSMTNSVQSKSMDSSNCPNLIPNGNAINNNQYDYYDNNDDCYYSEASSSPDDGDCNDQIYCSASANYFYDLVSFNF